jgi:hypothetical protein
MPRKQARKRLKAGQRVRDKLTGRTGAVEAVHAAAGERPTYAVSYDEAPQDAHLTTPAKEGAERPPELLDPAP